MGEGLEVDVVGYHDEGERCGGVEGVEEVDYAVAINRVQVSTTVHQMGVNIQEVSERKGRRYVGSSSKRTSGSLAMARAMVTRCCSPPDNCFGK